MPEREKSKSQPFLQESFTFAASVSTTHVCSFGVEGQVYVSQYLNVANAYQCELLGNTSGTVLACSHPAFGLFTGNWLATAETEKWTKLGLWSDPGELFLSGWLNEAGNKMVPPIILCTKPNRLDVDSYYDTGDKTATSTAPEHIKADCIAETAHLIIHFPVVSATRGRDYALWNFRASPPSYVYF